jgi:L-rhamnose mutarotase
MKRKAFVMSVHPDCLQEYEKRHNPIWPELASALKAGGAHNYSIFLDQRTSTLFAYVEIEDEERWNQIADTEICKKWWAHMREIMPSNPDNSPVSTELREVFHLNSLFPSS